MLFNLDVMLFNLGDLQDDVLKKGTFFPSLARKLTYIPAVIQFPETKTGHCISLMTGRTQSKIKDFEG